MDSPSGPTLLPCIAGQLLLAAAAAAAVADVSAPFHPLSFSALDSLQQAFAADSEEATEADEIAPEAVLAAAGVAVVFLQKALALYPKTELWRSGSRDQSLL